MAYVKCMDDMIKLMTKRGVRAAIPILAEAKASYGDPVSLIRTIQIELPKVSLVIGKDREVRSR